MFQNVFQGDELRRYRRGHRPRNNPRIRRSRFFFPNILTQLLCADWQLTCHVTFPFQTGRQSDKDGKTLSWWTNETLTRYLDRAQCFIEQYGNYSLTLQAGGNETRVTFIPFIRSIRSVNCAPFTK